MFFRGEVSSSNWTKLVSTATGTFLSCGCFYKNFMVKKDEGKAKFGGKMYRSHTDSIFFELVVTSFSALSFRSCLEA